MNLASRRNEDQNEIFRGKFLALIILLGICLAPFTLILVMYEEVSQFWSLLWYVSKSFTSFESEG
jgi:hypothetical protein